MDIIYDPYVSIEIEDQSLVSLRDSLRSYFGEGVCEIASSAAHVSIAYGEGEVTHDALNRALSEIAALPFSVSVKDFEILEGRTTEFDYLVITLEQRGSFGAALSAVRGCMKTRTFDGEFCSHVSLLKFPKGVLSREQAATLLQEMNACQRLASVLGREIRLKGAQVSVFTPDRRCCASKVIAAA